MQKKVVPANLNPLADFELLGTPSEHIFCPICLLLLHKPMRLMCGHVFCIQCFNTYILTDNKYGVCPLDRKQVEFSQVHRDFVAQKFIQTVFTKCDGGCGWTGPLRDAFSHRKYCITRKGLATTQASNMMLTQGAWTQQVQGCPTLPSTQQPQGTLAVAQTNQPGLAPEPQEPVSSVNMTLSAITTPETNGISPGPRAQPKQTTLTPIRKKGGRNQRSASTAATIRGG